jgi:hypothetical protein
MPLGLSYEEMLRTVGAVLDDTDHDLAVLDVSPQAVIIQTVGRSGRLELGFGQIQERSHERSRLRGQGPRPHPVGAPPRFEWVLRVVGAELDRIGESRYGLTVTRQSVSVEGAEGYQRVFDADTLTTLLRDAVRRRNQSRAH